jgi:outer membrane murein-binding lipoprotein Lpp
MRPTRVTPVLFAITLAGCLSLCVSAGNAQQPQKDTGPQPASREDDRVAQLERRVEELSRDNARLKQERDAALARRQAAERRVKDLERRIDRPQVRIVPAPLPPLQLQPMPERVPENWSPRQFNGITYYVIPLQQSSPPRQGTIAR